MLTGACVEAGCRTDCQPATLRPVCYEHPVTAKPRQTTEVIRSVPPTARIARYCTATSRASLAPASSADDIGPTVPPSYVLSFSTAYLPSFLRALGGKERVFSVQFQVSRQESIRRLPRFARTCLFRVFRVFRGGES